MIYLLTATELSPGGSGQYTCTQIEREKIYIYIYIYIYKETDTQTIQKHRAHKIEGKTYQTRKQT
jgi:hypothetical protein